MFVRRQAIIWTNALILLIGQTSMKFESIFTHFHSRNHIWKCLKNRAFYFVSALTVREITKSSSTSSATNISSNIVWLLQLHDTIQMEAIFCNQIQ